MTASKKPMTDGQRQRYLNGVAAFQDAHGKMPNANERTAIARAARRATA